MSSVAKVLAERNEVKRGGNASEGPVVQLVLRSSLDAKMKTQRPLFCAKKSRNSGITDEIEQLDG